MEARPPSAHDEVPLRFPDGTQAWAAPITPQGMQLRTQAQLRVGQFISVELRTAVADLAVTARGYVAVVNGAADGTTQATVRFIDLRAHRNS